MTILPLRSILGSRLAGNGSLTINIQDSGAAPLAARIELRADQTIEGRFGCWRASSLALNGVRTDIPVYATIWWANGSDPLTVTVQAS